MADTFTTTLSLTKPEVGASADTWGTKTNDNWDDVDGLFQAGPALKVAHGGTAATTASGARTSLGLGTMATQDASAVEITGGTISGVSVATISGATPALGLNETDAAADNRSWVIIANGEELAVQARSDDALTITQPIILARTGTTVDSIALTATAVTINGNAAHHAGTFTAPSSGSFTISLRSVSDVGTVIATGTAYWRKFNGVVTLRIPPMTAESTATAFWLTGLPADIQVGNLAIDTQQVVPIPVVNGGVLYSGLAYVPEQSSAMPLFANPAYPWTTASSGKGVGHATITYQVAD